MKKLAAVFFAIATLNVFSINPSCVEALNTFDAIYANKSVNFKWTLQNPDNTQGLFTIERSKDGKHFDKVTEIKTTLNGQGEVEFVDSDRHPLKKKAYYRLKYTDEKGMQTFSRTVYIEKKAKMATLKVSVTKDAEGIQFSKFKKNEQVLLVIRDKAGNEFCSKSVILGNENELVLDNQLKLEPGDYVIIASSPSSYYSRSFTIK